MRKLVVFAILLFAIASLCLPVAGQDANSQNAQGKKAGSNQQTASNDKVALFRKFERLLTNAKLTGHFTVDGRPLDKLNPETYEILSVKKLDEGDYWQFRTRVKYGSKDVVVPLALEVKWADDTPMITLTDLRIPLIGQGKFGARVLFYDDKYCGTWSHGEVTGHLFGTIGRMKTTNEDDQ